MQASFFVHLLTILSCLNALYTFTRKRHYRLFEAKIDTTPSTPSAKRVKVDSSPLSSSPLRFLSNVLAANSAEARAHPDSTTDVWEIRVWDPTPLCLRLFTLFSPGHVLVYWLFLPLAPLDPRPSVTVVTTIFLAGLLTAQLTLLHIFFSQQSKDSALIHREVQREYDKKYVHPALNRPVRSAGTQVVSDEFPNVREVETYTPVTFVNRGFRTNPNPEYAPLYDPNGFLQAQKRELSRMSDVGVSTPVFKTPNVSRSVNTPLRTATTSHIKQPQFRASGVGAGDGGSFGIHNHAHSPLRKPAASSALTSGASRREGSPLKRSSMPGMSLGDVQNPLRNRQSLFNGDRTRREHRDSGL